MFIKRMQVISQKSNRYTSFVLLLAVVILLTEGIASATDNPVSTTVNRYWRDSEGNYGTVSFNTNFYFTTNETWDDVYTTHNNIKFEHHYVQNDWPRDGHTAEEAKAYFDNKWNADGSSSGTASPKYNCWSFAFGRTGYWVNSDSEILSNDYESGDKSNATVASWSGHSCKVTDRGCTGGNYKITQIQQKDRGSAFFTFTYTDWDLKFSSNYTSEASLKKEKD